MSETRRYDVQLESAAKRELKAFDRPTQRRILVKLETLAANPRGTDTVKLAGNDDLYRSRVGQTASSTRSATGNSSS